jgi:hypothetical protein
VSDDIERACCVAMRDAAVEAVGDLKSDVAAVIRALPVPKEPRLTVGDIGGMLYSRVGEVMELLQPLDVVGEPNTMVALVAKAMRLLREQEAEISALKKERLELALRLAENLDGKTIMEWRDKVREYGSRLATIRTTTLDDAAKLVEERGRKIGGAVQPKPLAAAIRGLASNLKAEEI